MPLLADRVRETTTTTGTGTLALGGAVTGYQSFNTAFANGAQVYYVIQFGAEWELGIGTVGPGTLSRDTVLESSNLDAFVPFSVGLKDVFVSYLASRAVTTSDAATLTNKTIDDYTNNVGANSTHFRIKATGTIAKGAVVKATGYNPGEAAIEVAIVSSATDLALGICEQPLTAGQFGLAVVIGELFDVNTNGLTVNGILYSNGSGGFTQTKPSSGTYQPLGWVVRANTNNGVIAVNIVAPLYVEASTNTANTLVLRDGSGNFSAGTVTAALAGNATTATTADKVANALTAGTYLTSGGTFDGAAARTFAVDATSDNTASKVVARDASGNFSAGTITANLTGNISGTAPAGTLTGTTLASNVVSSSLTSVGTLSSLTVSGNTKIGGGAASNTSRLMVNTANGTAAGIQLFQDGQASWILENVASSATLRLSESSVERMSINSLGNVAFDTNTLYVDAANNRVGVGTASPATLLDVRGSAVGGNVSAIQIDNAAAGSGSPPNTVSLNFANAGSAKASITAGVYGDGYMDFATNDNTVKLRLTASGNLGIGTTSPAQKLEVFNAGDVYMRLTGNIASGNVAGVQFIRNGGSVVNAQISAVTEIANDYGVLRFATAGVSGLAERARIDSSGNLGLGVTPSAWAIPSIQFQGQFAIGPFGYTRNGYYDTGWKYVAAGQATAYQQASGIHSWYTAPSGTAGNAITFTQAMTLDASGNLLVGTTSGSSNRFYVAGTGQNVTATIADSAGPFLSFLDVANAEFAIGIPDNSGALAFVSGRNNGGSAGTERARIHASGGMSLGTTTDPGAGVFLANTEVRSPRLSTTTATSFGSVLSGTASLHYADSTYGAAIAGSGSTSDVTILGRNGNVIFTANDTSGIRLGFYGTAPQGKPTITGSRGGNAALANLLTALANLGLLIDSTT